MSYRRFASRSLIAVSVLAIVACVDSPNPLAPSDATFDRGVSQDRLAEVFARVSPLILARPGTVFADHDEAGGKLVFGVENANVGRGVDQALSALGVAGADYEVRVTQPIHQMATLRDAFRPTQGGTQIHFSSWLCTLGFNVAHSGGRSFITNSHCTNKQGGTEGTIYYQPTSSSQPGSIGTEVDDPDYFTGGACPASRRCRYSDAARVLYSSGTSSSQGVIAKTTGSNNGSITVSGSFTVNAQNNTSTSFSGTIHKVGRTTGWTSGSVYATCANVNVSGSNITQLCQTLVWWPFAQIVGGGDSGSPVFTSGSGDNVTLIGILWGGSGTGDMFVFSPLKNIQDELGAFTATAGGSPPPPVEEEPPAEEPPPACVPKGKNGKNCK